MTTTSEEQAALDLQHAQLALSAAWNGKNLGQPDAPTLEWLTTPEGGRPTGRVGVVEVEYPDPRGGNRPPLVERVVRVFDGACQIRRTADGAPLTLEALADELRFGFDRYGGVTSLAVSKKVGLFDWRRSPPRP